MVANPFGDLPLFLFGLVANLVLWITPQWLPWFIHFTVLFRAIPLELVPSEAYPFTDLIFKFCFVAFLYRALSFSMEAAVFLLIHLFVFLPEAGVYTFF